MKIKELQSPGFAGSSIDTEEVKNAYFGGGSGINVYMQSESSFVESKLFQGLNDDE